jgi:hypothetical protein
MWEGVDKMEIQFKANQFGSYCKIENKWTGRKNGLTFKIERQSKFISSTETIENYRLAVLKPLSRYKRTSPINHENLYTNFNDDIGFLSFEEAKLFAEDWLTHYLQ